MKSLYSHVVYENDVLPNVAKGTLLIDCSTIDVESARHVAALAEKAIFLAELKAYAAGHGYKPGWAAVKYKGRFEVWPDWSIKNVPASATISITDPSG